MTERDSEDRFPIRLASWLTGLEVGLARITQRSDYSEYGGALLLGVEGIVTIAHGRSNARAIANAIRVSGEAVQTAVNQEIVEEIRRLGPTGRVEGTKP